MTPPRIPFWAANGGGIPFELTLEATDIVLHRPGTGDTPLTGDMIALLMGPSGGELLPSPDHATLMNSGGEPVALEAGLRLLGTPQELGFQTDDRVTFTALFNAEAVVPIPPPAGIVGWWPGDGNADDVVGDNHGILLGDATFVPGKEGQAFNFDGLDDEVFISSTFPFHQPSDATLDFWLNTPATGHQAVFWTRADDEDESRFHFFVNGTSTFAFDYRSPSGALHTLVGEGDCCGVGIQRNIWTHLAITRTVNVYRVYVDGVLGATAVDASPDLPTATGWQMSGRAGYIFQGKVDEVSIYNRALSAEEVRAIYEAGSAGKIKPQ